MDKDTVAMVAAIVAIITGLIAVFWNFIDRRDKVRVVINLPTFPNLSQEAWVSLYVVNTGKREVELFDYGFITVSGKLESIPEEYWSTPDDYRDDLISIVGEPRLKPVDRLKAAKHHNRKHIGAYARTTTRASPYLAFAPGIGLLQCLRLRAAIWLRFL